MTIDGPGNVNGMPQRVELPLVNAGQQPQPAVGNVPVGGGLGGRPGVALERPGQAQIDADFEKSGFALTKEEIKAEKKRLGIGTTVFGKLFGAALKTDRTIEIHDRYAKMIFSEAYGDDPVLTQLASQYIGELPKASRRNQERMYISNCEQKLEAFRDAVRDYNLSMGQVRLDENAENRFNQEVMLDNARQAAMTQHFDESQAAQTAHFDESQAEQTAQINQHTTDVGGTVVRRVNNHTTQVGNSVVGRVNTHITNETNRGIDTNLQNAKKLQGIHEDQWNPDTESYDRSVQLSDGTELSYDYTIMGDSEWQHNRTNEKIDDVGQKVEVVGKQVQGVSEQVSDLQQQTQQNSVLQSKRQALTEMLQAEGADFYRDSTVLWLGSAADEILASGLTYDAKCNALDELVVMVNEENVISDGDKEAFYNKYFGKK